MRTKFILPAFIIMLSSGAAQAGSCTGVAHCSSYENGVVVLRGQHTPAVSQGALLIDQQRAEQARRAKAQAEAERLARAVEAQNREIAALRTQVSSLQPQKTQRPRRRVYFGNPAFFGRNGFIGNRYFGGSTVQLPRRPYRAPHRGPN